MTTETPQPQTQDNETSIFTETSTGLDVFSYGNQSDSNNLSSCPNTSSINRPASMGIYGYGYWSIILFICVMGIIGNILVLVMMRDRKLNFLSYSVYLQFLAVTDTLLLVSRLVQETERMFFVQRIVPSNTLSWKLYFSFKVFLRIISPWLVAGLSLDRYVCVCFPFKKEMLCTRRKATIVCSAMLLLSIFLIVPILTAQAEGDCLPMNMFKYYMVIRLAFSSIGPSLAILFLNIFMIIHINRSRMFRKTFMTSDSGPANQQRDKATRPLVLVSVLAFLTLLPVSVSETVEISLQILKTNVKALILAKQLWPIFIVIYTLNFGQNFYILIGSSSSYRDIIKRRLFDCIVKWHQRRRRNEAEQSGISNKNRVSATGSTDLSLPIPSFDTTDPAVESVEYKGTDLSIAM